MTVNPRDRARYRKCLTCDALVLPPRRKCNACKTSKVYKVETLRGSRKGMNKRGTCLHKPDKIRTKRAKRQNTNLLGEKPTMPLNARIMRGKQ